MAAFKLITILGALCAVCMPTVHGMGRIVGGIQSDIERRPYQASLQYNISGFIAHSCGASIISTKWLLSTARCNPGSTNIQQLWARVGSTAYNSGGQSIKVTKFIAHPEFISDLLDYDYAVVGFADGDEITLGLRVAIIPLASDINPTPGSIAVISGWGVTSESSTSAPIYLMEANIPVVNDEVCNQTYGFLTERQICLGGTPEGMLSACFGDFGGPAVQNGVQFGLVSAVKSCELPNTPGIFAKITYVRDWITEQTGV